MKMIKKFVACLVAAGLVFGSIPVYASNPSARNITIFRVDGNNVSLSRGDARSATPRDGQRLSDGNILTTGLNSSVHIQMDANSLLQMSASSQVAVSQSGNNLVLSVQSGSALVEVRDQGAGNSTETRLGNVGLTVRGTMYTMGLNNDFVSIVMLSGYGDVEGESLYAGQIMHVFDEHRPGADVLHYETGYFRLIYLGIDTLDVLDLFTLEVMYEHRGYLLEVGTLTPEMLEVLPDFIHDRRIEAEDALLADTGLLPPTVILPPPYEAEEVPEEIERTPRPPADSDDDSGTVVNVPTISISSDADFIYHLLENPCPNGWQGTRFVLTQSIILPADVDPIVGGHPGNPIPFRGIFDGGGYNIILAAADLSNLNSVGLFAVVGNGGVVRNFTIATVQLADPSGFVGAVAGEVASGGLISNVSVATASVSAHASANAIGGIVGVVRNGGRIHDVRVTGSISITSTTHVRGVIAGVLEAGAIVDGWEWSWTDGQFGVNNAPPDYFGERHPDAILRNPPVGFAGLFMTLMLFEFDDYEECPEDYPAKEDENDYDNPAKNKEDDDELDEDDEEDDEEDDDDEQYDEYPEDDYGYDEEEEYAKQEEDYVPTYPEDDYEPAGYYN